MRILFLGTPEFAVESLRQLYEAQFNIVAVVTMPDKASGRGRALTASAVKVFAEEKGLKVLQPEKLKSPEFIEQLHQLKPDLGVVVAFRMLPEVVWNLPRLGTINLHGSLLPNYRGAAPINWAVMNGETQTGYTIFKLKHEIDTGDVLAQETMPIHPEEHAGSVHDRMKVLGASLLVKVVNQLKEGSIQPIPQSALREEQALKPAPKLFREDGRILPHFSAKKAHDLVRGLAPHPGAWLVLKQASGELTEYKLLQTRLHASPEGHPMAQVVTDHKRTAGIGFKDGFLQFEVIQAPGKRPMRIQEFLAGNKFVEGTVLV